MANLVSYSQSPFNKSRKDKFLMVLNYPEALKKISKKVIRDNDTIQSDSLQFSVFGSVVPDIEVPNLDIRYSGQTLAASSHARPPYPPVTVSFTIDNRFNNYWVIFKWLNLLNDARQNIFDSTNLSNKPVLPTSTDKFLQYRANLSIYALDEYDKRTVEFLYSNAFPTTLGAINFNNRDAGEIETSFTFSYSQLIVSLVEQVDSL